MNSFNCPFKILARSVPLRLINIHHLILQNSLQSIKFEIATSVHRHRRRLIHNQELISLFYDIRLLIQNWGFLPHSFVHDMVTIFDGVIDLNILFVDGDHPFKLGIGLRIIVILPVGYSFFIIKFRKSFKFLSVDRD